MIPEGESYTPYYVLTDDYGEDENCLLLRKYLLNESYPYASGDDVTPYYPYSYVDDFLNDDFIQIIPESVRSKILDSPVEITKETSYYGGERETESILRKVFILSQKEVSGISSSAFLKEGKKLEYFNCDDRRVAKKRKWRNVQLVASYDLLHG